MFQFLEDYLLILTSLEAVVAHRCLRNKAIAFTEGYLGPCQTFPVFGLNTERYFVSLCIQSKLGKIRTGITPNTDSFNVVLVLRKNYRKLMRLFCSPDFHSVKNQNFRKLTGVKILWKCAVSAEFRINWLKFCKNCIFEKFPYQEIWWNFDILQSARYSSCLR